MDNLFKVPWMKALYKCIIDHVRSTDSNYMKCFFTYSLLSCTLKCLKCPEMLTKDVCGRIDKSRGQKLPVYSFEGNV